MWYSCLGGKYIVRTHNCEYPKKRSLDWRYFAALGVTHILLTFPTFLPCFIRWIYQKPQSLQLIASKVLENCKIDVIKHHIVGYSLHG